MDPEAVLGYARSTPPAGVEFDNTLQLAPDLNFGGEAMDESLWNQLFNERATPLIESMAPIYRDNSQSAADESVIPPLIDDESSNPLQMNVEQFTRR